MGWDLLPDGCLERGTVIGAFLALFSIAAFVLAGGAGFDLSAWMNGQAPRQIPQAQQGQNGPGNGVGGGQLSDVPIISDRLFSTGSVQSTVSGDLTFDVDLSLDTDKSYVADDLAWIAYEDGGLVTVLVSLHEPENSVAISDGQHTALGVDTQCVFNVTVTPALVSGHVSCPKAQALDGAKQVGTTSIELDFSAGTLPGSEGGGGGSDQGGDSTPTDEPTPGQ